MKIDDYACYKRVYLGNHSVYVGELSEGYVCHDQLLEGLPITNSRIVRHHLNELLKATGRKRVGFNRETYQYCFVPQPLYCSPSDVPFDAVYLDLSAAFWNIYRHLSLDVFYDGRHLANGAGLFSQLPREYSFMKSARNSVVGITRARSQTYYNQGKAIICPSHNKFLAPQLWGFISHYLHEIASLAVACGAVYVNTDGYIFPSHLTTEISLFCSHIEGYSWKLEEKHRGQCFLSGVGKYRFGSVGPIEQRLCPFSNIQEHSGKLELLYRVQTLNLRC